MGMIFYRLILTNGFILSLQEVVQALVMTYCFHKPPQMDAAKFFVNIVDTQAGQDVSKLVYKSHGVGIGVAGKHRCTAVASLWCAVQRHNVLCQDLVGIKHL